MKTTYLTIALTVQILVSFAQTSTKEKVKEQSNAEIFSNQAGTLIQKEFEDVGSVKKCGIQIAKFADLISGRTSKAVRFEFNYSSAYSSDTKLALLDVDEIDGLIKSLKLIQEKIFPTSPTNYTEVSFRSRSGFEAGCFSNKGSWSTYLQLERYDKNSYVFMDKEHLGILLTLLEQAKEKLK